MKRNETRAIKVGNLTIGGNDEVVIQSMTNTKTKDIEATVKQINELANTGCQLVRLAVLNMDDALAIKEIKNRVNVPLVADIHFDYRLALQAIESGIDKIRINPGNIGSIDKVKLVVEACKKKHIPIRIGVNGGSLEKEILEKYGKPTAQGMIDSAKKHVEILESLDLQKYLSHIILLKNFKLQRKITVQFWLGVINYGFQRDIQLVFLICFLYQKRFLNWHMLQALE